MESYVRMIPVLRAEEAMAAANQIAVGSGVMRSEDRQRVVSSWERAARAGRPEPRIRPTPDQLRQLGIGVKVAKKTSEAHGG